VELLVIESSYGARKSLTFCEAFYLFFVQSNPKIQNIFPCQIFTIILNILY